MKKNKNKKKYSVKQKRNIVKFRIKLRKLNKKFIDFDFDIILLDFIKWKLIDIYRKYRYGEDLRLYGIRCVVGMYGMGKTMSMTMLANDYRKKYGDKIYICSNYNLKIQDFAFADINQVAITYDRPVIFFWDEVQNDFPSDDRTFPRAIRKAFSLTRKGHGKMFYWASQDHELVHKTIRRLTIEYGMAKTIFKRLTRIRWYRKLDYEALYEQTDINKRMKIHSFKKQTFVQTDYLRNLYESFTEDNGEHLKKDVI